MEASLCALPSTRAPPPLHSQSQVLFPHSTRLPFPDLCRRHLPSRTTLLIRAAISRTKKEATVETVKQQLENCYLIAAINYKGVTVNQFRELRRSLPDEVKLVVAKNTLVGKAIEGTPWEALKPCMKGMNAWMFVHTEDIPGGIKPYRSFQKELKLEDNDFTGAVFEGKFYGPGDFKALETMPTRAEVYSKILGSLQSPGIALVSTLQAPARDLVLTLKAYVKKLEEGGSAAQ